jgi:hypothetical protein
MPLWIAGGIYGVIKCCAMNLAEPSWHLFAAFKRIDFVMAWKAISIALTGAFGILGLVTEFKNKHTHKITKWGRVSLVGIIISTVLGVAAQLKESSDDAAKALRLAQSSERTLKEISRTLSPLEDPVLTVRLEVACHIDDTIAQFCSSKKQTNNKADRPIPDLAYWPYVKNRKVGFMVRLAFYASSSDVNGMLMKNIEGNWLIDISAKPEKTLIAERHGTNEVELAVFNQKPGQLESDGKLASLEDIPGSTMLLWVVEPSDNHYLHPTFVYLAFKNGQSLSTFGPFQQHRFNGEVVYTYKFPKTSKEITPQSDGSSAAPR